MLNRPETWLRFSLAAMLLGLLIVRPAACADPQAQTATPAAEVKFDLDSFARVIHPLQHPLGDRMPLLLWNFPLPRGAELVTMRQDGSLRKAIDMMWARGIVPTVEMGWSWTPEGALAMAQTLQEAQVPVHVLWPWLPGGAEELYKKNTIWMDGPDASWGGKTRHWPCYPCYDTTYSHDVLVDWMHKYQAAGVTLTGMWYDYEDIPHAWNGGYEAQKSSPECVAKYPPGVLDSFATFRPYVEELRAKIFDGALADPIREVFPQALVANYGDMATGHLSASMPSCYAEPSWLHRALKTTLPTQQTADMIYFRGLLAGATAPMKTLPTGKVLIPYLNQTMGDDKDPQWNLKMSDPAYTELIRHLLLRGAYGFYLFNLGYSPASGATAQFSFQSIEDVCTAYDELLAYPEFLDKGTPMNQEILPEGSTGAIWSGLRLGDRCLIRAFTQGTEPVKVTIPLGDNSRVTLDAPPEGATYMVEADGTFKQL